MIKVDVNNFNDVIGQDTAIVEFYATWCGPCKQMNKTLAEVEKTYDVPVGKIDVDDNHKVAQIYGVSSIPTTVLFKNGVEVQRVIGAKNVSELAKSFML